MAGPAAGRVPAIHGFLARRGKPWMAGPSPATTMAEPWDASFTDTIRARPLCLNAKACAKALPPRWRCAIAFRPAQAEDCGTSHSINREDAMQTLPQIDQVLRKGIDAGDVPGIVAMAATRDGPVYEGAFGKRALPEGPAMTADSVFWIASMTKAITTTAAMQLVERGKLALDSPISPVLPELKSPKVLEGFDPSGEPRLRAAKRPITLRHLVTHTAGFGYDIWSPDLLRYKEKKGIPSITTCENLALTTPLTFDPGEKWDYGINIDWVGKAVEAVSGKRLEAYLRDRILAPLGMTDTGFVLRADQRARLAAMHARGPDGTLQAIPFELPQEPEFFMGGGGLHGTARDYLRFLNMILGGGTLDGVEILKRETVREMAQNNIGD